MKPTVTFNPTDEVFVLPTRPERLVTDEGIALVESVDQEPIEEAPADDLSGSEDDETLLDKYVVREIASKIVHGLLDDGAEVKEDTFKDAIAKGREELKNLKHSNQLARFLRSVIFNIKRGRSIKRALEEAEDDEDFEDDLQDSFEDEELYRQMRELAMRKKARGSIDPNTLAMKEDVALGAGGDAPQSSVFSLFQSKS